MSRQRPARRVQSTSRRLLLAALLGLSAAGGAACSLINSFDELKRDGGAGGAGGSGGASTASSSSSSSASSASSSSSSSSSGTGGGADAGTHGIVVVGGRIVDQGVPTSKRVFAVIDAATGEQLSRYSDLPLVAATYDRATDLWYLFEAETLPADIDKPMKLHVGTIDPANGKWNEKTSASANLPVIANAIDVGVLDKRLVYAAFDPKYEAGVPPLGLAVIDTSQVPSGAPVAAPFASPGFISLEQVQDGGLLKYVGITATPKTPGPGGYANLIAQTCTSGPNGICTFYRYFMSFGADPASEPVPSQSVGTMIPKALNGISAAWGTLFQNADYDVVAYPPPAGAGVDGGDAGAPIAKVLRFDVNKDIVTDLTSFEVEPVASGEQFTGLAVADCEKVLLLAERNAQRLYAVPLPDQLGMQVTAAELPVNEVTSLLYFDPVTSNVLMPLQPAASTFHLNAWHLGSDGTGPTLTPLTGGAWKPPSDLAIDVVAVRKPLDFVCP